MPVVARSLFFLGVFSLSTSALAYSVNTRFENGDTYSSQRLSLSHTPKKDDEPVFVDMWKISGEGNRTKNTDGSIYNGRAGSGELKLGFGENWNGILDLDKTTTSEVSYERTEGSLGIGYHYLFKDEAKKDSDKDSFAPRISITGYFGSGTNKQNVDFLILNTHVHRDVEIKQTSSSLELEGDVVSWLTIGLSATKYSYDKSKNDLAAATKSKLLNQKTGDLVNTIFGLQDSSESLTFSFYLGDAWDLEFIFSQSKTYVDEAITNGFETELSYNFENGLNLGIGYTDSVTDSQHDTTGVLTVGYHF